MPAIEILAHKEYNCHNLGQGIIPWKMMFKMIFRGYPGSDVKSIQAKKIDVKSHQGEKMLIGRWTVSSMVRLQLRVAYNKYWVQWGVIKMSHAGKDKLLPYTRVYSKNIFWTKCKTWRVSMLI